MPIERRSRPIRLRLPLQRRQVLVKPLRDGISRHAKLVRVMIAVGDKFRCRSRGDRAGGFQFLDLGDDGGADVVVGEGG